MLRKTSRAGVDMAGCPDSGHGSPGCPTQARVQTDGRRQKLPPGPSPGTQGCPRQQPWGGAPSHVGRGPLMESLARNKPGPVSTGSV